MGITHRLNSLAHDLLTPISVSEADIREELEFHVQQRAMENIAAGMSPEEAQLDAEKRFGDFEHNVRGCRHASMGIRVWLSYIQWTLFAMLLGSVLWLTTSMFQMQSQYESEITDLREQLAFSSTAPADSVEQIDNSMNIKQWNFPVSQRSLTPTTVENFAKNISVSPGEAWCDWSSLDLNQND